MKTLRLFGRILHNAPLVAHIRTISSGSKDPKRFYKNVTISKAEDGLGWELNLDRRKLRTPGGSVFRVPSEPLAVAVAAEWENQAVTIERAKMHLTTLSNTAIDNPTYKTREQKIAAVLHFLETDTICYQSREPEDLYQLQQQKWTPVVQWAADRYQVHLDIKTGITGPAIPSDTLKTFEQHLQSYSDWALVGYQYAADLLKSLLLSSALIERQLSVEQAVDLSRLELDFQTQRWGEVEWFHGIELFDTRTRLAAATIFTHLSCESQTVVQKTAVR